MKLIIQYLQFWTLQLQHYLSHEQKTLGYFPFNWLFNRDPCNGLLQSSHNWVAVHPLYTLKNQAGHCSFRSAQKGNIEVHFAPRVADFTDQESEMYPPQN